MKLNILFSVMTLVLLNGYAIGQTRNFPVGNKVNLEVTTRTGNNFNWEKIINLNSYGTSSTTSARVIETTTGASSAARIGATVEATVSRQSVLSGAFGLVKKGAQLAVSSRGNLYIGGALLAYEAYQAVKGDLESQGYHYDESKEEFYKDWAARSCIWERDDNDRTYDVDCYGVDSSIIRHRSTDDPKKQEEIKFLMEAKMERLARPYWKVKQKRLAEGDTVLDWNKYIFDKCYFTWNGGDCSVKRGDDGRSVIHFSLKMNEREILTPQKFLQIATPSIDANPTPFVEGTGRPGYSEGVQVSPGTVVTLGPVTGHDNKPVQIQITFGRDSNGKTTASVNTTPRPDLTPGSPAAPKTNPTPTPGENGKPGSQPDPNPDGKPGSQPDPTPDGSPSDKTKPDPDDSPSGKDKPDPSNTPDGKDDPKPDDKPKEDEKPKEGGGLLCDVFPNILACDKMGKPEEGMFDAISIPQTTDDRTWSSDDFLPANGVCPQPKTFTVWGKTMTVSYEPLCTFAEKVRFAVLLSFIIMSAFIVFGSLKRG